jgi:pimeloyl-ACP methyl ester carboxylesterase
MARTRSKPVPDPFAPLAVEELVAAPGPWQLMLEARAPWELAALLAATPWLNQLPRGDGHPVIVFPGLGASDASTLPLRQFLRQRGYTPYAWQQGFNFGPRHGVLDAARERVRHIAERHGEAVSLVGWSLGGIYAREIAKEQPALARCVVTLGSPFAGHPRATNAWRFYELVSGQAVHSDEELLAQIRQPPACPTTSVYSRTDGIVAWQCSLNPSAPHTENIEVHASHVGMGLNPLALYVVADRLAQPVGGWQPFDVKGARRWFFKTTHQSPLQAAR